MKNLRVLIVDDEAHFLELMKTRVESWGHTVTGAGEGKAAVQAAKDKSADVIVLDYLMWDMDGMEALKKIREINKEIPVIMFTAYPEVEAQEQARKLGVSAFVPKLSEVQDAQNALKSALEIVA